MSEDESVEGGGAISRELSENTAWNQQNAPNIILDSNLQQDISVTPRTNERGVHLYSHLEQEINENPVITTPQLSSKQEKVMISNPISSQNNLETFQDSIIENNTSAQPKEMRQEVDQKDQRKDMKLLNSLYSLSLDSKKNENLDEIEMFEVEKQLKRLHHSINASKQKEHNAYIQFKPFYHRFFTCGFMTQPSHCTMETLYERSKTCDLFFQRKGYEFEGDLLSEDILRGVKSTLEGKYMPKSCHLNLWSHVGIIISLTTKQNTTKPSPREMTTPTTQIALPISSQTPLSLLADQPKPQHRKSILSRILPLKEIKTKYLLVANERGISLRNFHEILATCDVILRGSLPTGRYVAAYRPIRVTKLGIPQYCHMCEYLEEIARAALAAGGLLLWRDLFTIYQHILAVDPTSPSADPIPLLPLPPYLPCPSPSLSSFSFLRIFFSRLSSVSYRPSNESIAEAIRCFHLIATSQLSNTDPTEIEQKYKTNSGKTLLRFKSQFEVISVESLRVGLRGILRIPTSPAAKNHLNSSQQNEAANITPMEPQVNGVVDIDSTHQLEKLLNAFEANTAKDGMISLVTFLSLCPLTSPI